MGSFNCPIPLACAVKCWLHLFEIQQLGIKFSKKCYILNETNTRPYSKSPLTFPLMFSCTFQYRLSPSEAIHLLQIVTAEHDKKQWALFDQAHRFGQTPPKQFRVSTMYRHMPWQLATERCCLSKTCLQALQMLFPLVPVIVPSYPGYICLNKKINK